MTVLFADITGSTALGERLDAEELKEVMGAFFAAMRAEIEAEGGTVEKFIGDAIMAAFGVPRVHEDDPARALRAALRMRARLGNLNEELDERYGVTLELRIGINTGSVMAVTDPRPARRSRPAMPSTRRRASNRPLSRGRCSSRSGPRRPLPLPLLPSPGAGAARQRPSRCAPSSSSATSRSPRARCRAFVPRSSAAAASWSC